MRLKYLLILFGLWSLTVGGGVAHGQSGRFAAHRCDSHASRTASRREPTTFDMTAAPEGVPNGAVNSAGKAIGWALRPRVWRGNRMLPGWTHGIATGMIYTADRTVPVSGVRVVVRNLRLFVRPRRTGRWCLLDEVRTPYGAMFYENFAGDVSFPAALRREVGGGVSVQLVAKRNFHFWARRVAIPNGGISGVYSDYEARLISDPGTPRESLLRTAYLGAASADYWRSLTALPGHVQILNEDVAIGRFKRITSEWRIFTMNSNGGKPIAPPTSE